LEWRKHFRRHTNLNRNLSDSRIVRPGRGIRLLGLPEPKAAFSLIANKPYVAALLSLFSSWISLLLFLLFVGGVAGFNLKL